MARKKRAKPPVNPRNFEGQDDEYVLKQVMEDIERSEKYIEPRLAEFSKFYKLYNSKMDETDKRQNGSNLFIPYTYSQIETAIPKLLGSIFETRPFISYKAVGSQDEEKAKKMTGLIGYQMDKYMKFVTELYGVFKGTLTYGTAISQQTWKYKTKTSIRRVYKDTTVQVSDGTDTATKQLQPEEYEKVVYDAPSFKNIPIEDFFFDPSAVEVEDCSYCGRKYYKELHELVEGEAKDIYKNVDEVAEASEQQDTKVITSDRAKAGMHNGVLIHEYWTDDWKVLIANKSVVIQCIKNPYYHKKKPFVKWVGIPMPNEFYGKSMVDTLADLQIELNTIRNQRIDNVTMALNRMWLLSKTADIDTSQLVSRPNGFIEVDDVDKDIKELEMRDVTQTAYQDEQVIKSDMDTTSGIHDYDRGSSPQGQDTATVANLLSSASSERFRLVVMMLANDPLNEVGTQLAELNKQFLTEETYIKIMDSEGVETEDVVTFDDIDIDFDVIPVSTALEPSVNKEIRQSQLVQLLNIAANIPEVNKVELMREIFKAFDFKNIDEMVQAAPPPDPTTETPQTPDQSTPQGGGQSSQTTADAGGLYPQMGGVGGMANYLQNPVA